jgi:uncharacterized membrane protein
LGAGVAVLYLSVFASFNFYSLISQPIAFVAMSTVTAITFERALKFESLAVGLLGWAGGFLTPALLWESSGTSSGTGLFIYLVALNVAMLGLAALRSRTWWILEPLSFFATWLTYAIWIDAEFVDPLRVPTVAFVVVIWSLYFVLQIRKLTAAEPKRRALNVLIGGLNAAFVLGALSTLIGEPYPNVMGAVAFAFAIIYLGTSMALPKTQVSLEITAASFLLLAIGFQFEDFVAVGLWSLEALFLFWRGLTKDRRYLRFTALAVYGIAAFGLLVTDGALSVASPSRFTVLANTRFAAFVVVAALGYFSAQLYRKHEASEKGWVPSLLHYLWGALVFILFTVETVDFYRGLMATAAPLETQGLVFSRAMVLALVWAAFGLGMIGFAYLTELKPTAMVGLFGLGLAIALAAMRGIVFEPATDFTLILNLRALAMMGVIGAVVASMKLLNEMPEGIKELQRVLGSLVALLIFVLVTGETRDIFQKQLADVVPPPSGFLPQPPTDDQLTRINTLENQKQLAISGIWLAYSFIGMAIGILRRRLGYRIAAIVLFGVIIVKVFFFDLSFLDSIYRTTSFIGLGLILLLVSFLYQRYRSVLFEPRNPTPGPQSEPPASP